MTFLSSRLFFFLYTFYHACFQWTSNRCFDWYFKDSSNCLLYVNLTSQEFATTIGAFSKTIFLMRFYKLLSPLGGVGTKFFVCLIWSFICLLWKVCNTFTRFNKKKRLNFKKVTFLNIFLLWIVLWELFFITLPGPQNRYCFFFQLFNFF